MSVPIRNRDMAPMAPGVLPAPGWKIRPAGAAAEKLSWQQAREPPLTCDCRTQAGRPSRAAILSSHPDDVSWLARTGNGRACTGDGRACTAERTPVSLSKVTAALCGLIGIAGIAACGSGTAATPPSARMPVTPPRMPVTTAPGATECAKSPPAMVGKALGLTVGEVVASAEGPVTVCAYTGRYEVLVRYQAGENTSSFARDRQSASKLHQSVTSVGGLGDEAYFARYTASKPASYTLATRKDGMAVFVTSPASLSAERGLMSALLRKL